MRTRHHDRGRRRVSGGKVPDHADVFDSYSNDIADLMANDMAASLENMMAGAPPAKDPSGESMSGVHDLFVAFLDNTNERIAWRAYAARWMVSKRFKNKKGRRALVH
jgi:hypothetical protein